MFQVVWLPKKIARIWMKKHSSQKEFFDATKYSASIDISRRGNEDEQREAHAPTIQPSNETFGYRMHRLNRWKCLRQFPFRIAHCLSLLLRLKAFFVRFFVYRTLISAFEPASVNIHHSSHLFSIKFMNISRIIKKTSIWKKIETVIIWKK